MDEVRLSKQCSPNQTLETAYTLQFQLALPSPWRSVVVWQDRPKYVRPLEPKRLRDLRPGDKVLYEGRIETIHAVEVYR